LTDRARLPVPAAAATSARKRQIGCDENDVSQVDVLFLGGRWNRSDVEHQGRRSLGKGDDCCGNRHM
jgi:hypothetical protein